MNTQDTQDTSPVQSASNPETENDPFTLAEIVRFPNDCRLPTFLEELISNKDDKEWEFVFALEWGVYMLAKELWLEIRERHQRLEIEKRQRRSETGEIKTELEKAFDVGDRFIMDVESIVEDGRVQDSDYFGIKELLRSTLARMDKALKRQQIEEKVLEEFQPKIDKEALRRLGAETFEALAEQEIKTQDRDAKEKAHYQLANVFSDMAQKVQKEEFAHAIEEAIAQHMAR